MSYWSGMSAGARKLEVQRRRDVAKRNKKLKSVKKLIPILSKRDKLIISLAHSNLNIAAIAQIMHVYDSVE